MKQWSCVKCGELFEPRESAFRDPDWVKPNDTYCKACAFGDRGEQVNEEKARGLYYLNNILRKLEKEPDSFDKKFEYKTVQWLRERILEVPEKKACRHTVTRKSKYGELEIEWCLGCGAAFINGQWLIDGNT